MSNEILSILEYMEKEKGIPRTDMIGAISNSLRNAALKGVHAGQDLKVEIDPKTGQIQAWAIMTVCDPVGDVETEISLEKARLFKADAQIGDVVEKPVDPASLGRISAQAARQAIMQRIREFERERIFDDYKDQVGDVITGVVLRREKSDIIIDLGKTEAILPRRERIPRENFNPGDRIRALLLKIDSGARGPNIILSRSSIRFVRRLLDLEVTEIADGTVTIERMARDPGYRTKICVLSSDPKVDPVGACVGARGSRVKSIVRELGGEKIDIMRHFTDPAEMLAEALRPAIPRNVQVDEANHRMSFEIAEDQLSLTIGKGGQNARLTSQLLGWKLDIRREEVTNLTMGQQKTQAARLLVETFDFDPPQAMQLVEAGITSPAVFEDVKMADLIQLGFTEEAAAGIVAKVEARN